MSTKKIILWLTLFSIAMGFMESAVVVYLRKIYYPNGFVFPLIPIEKDIAMVEVLREMATVIMLWGIGYLTATNFLRRFSHFVYCFAIWDIFYYVFLKLLLNWPESLFTWDVLFLIPVPWVGPVLAPCLLSLTMIALTLSVIYFQEKGIDTKINKKEWSLFITGAITVIFSFTLEYFKHIGQHKSVSDIWTFSSETDLGSDIITFVPETFNWLIFSTGEVLILTAMFLLIKRCGKLI